MNVLKGNHDRRLFILLFLGGVLCVPVFASESDSTLVLERRSGYSPNPPRIFRLYADGRINQLRLPAHHGGGGSFWGSYEPSLAPDQGYVAYCRERNVWLRHVRTGKDTQLTELGKSGGNKYRDFSFSVSAWSPDSTRLLVYGSHEDGLGSLNERPIQEGFYDCDIARKSCRYAPSLDKMLFQGWTATGEYIAASKSIHSHIWRVSRDDPQAKPVNLLSVYGEYGYPLVSVSRDGRWLIAFEVDRKPWSWMDTFRSIFGVYQIPPERPVMLNLVSGERRQVPGLTSRDQVGRGNQLKLSPSGKHVAYLGSVAPADSEGIVVDGRKLAAARGRFDWINDQVLVVHEPDRIVVVQVDADQILGSVQVEAGIRPVPRSP